MAGWLIERKQQQASSDASRFSKQTKPTNLFFSSPLLHLTPKVRESLGMVVNCTVLCILTVMLYKHCLKVILVPNCHPSPLPLAAWVLEHFRMLITQLNDLISRLGPTGLCNHMSCPVMCCGELQYLCASHPGERCMKAGGQSCYRTCLPNSSISPPLKPASPSSLQSPSHAAPWTTCCTQWMAQPLSSPAARFSLLVSLSRLQPTRTFQTWPGASIAACRMHGCTTQQSLLLLRWTQAALQG